MIPQLRGHGLRAYTSSVGCADTFPSKGKAKKYANQKEERRNRQ